MTIFLSAGPAHAFAPEVPRALARLAVAPGTAADEAARLLGEQAASAVDARLAGEALDPEAHASAHVYFVDEASSIGFGTAPDALASAYTALEQGFVEADPAAILRSTAALAIAAADLADPFRTAEPGRAGPAGARARFADRITASDLPTTGPSAGATPPIGSALDARAAGSALAARSAALRDSVELLAAADRGTELAALRRGRIDDALALTLALAAGARQAADRAVLDATSGSPRGRVSVLPNPARGHSLLAFRTTVGGTARVQVLSASGRRVAAFDVPVEAGAVAIALDSSLPAGLAPGAYFARVLAPGVDAVARFVRIAP